MASASSALHAIVAPSAPVVDRDALGARIDSGDDLHSVGSADGADDLSSHPAGGTGDKHSDHASSPSVSGSSLANAAARSSSNGPTIASVVGAARTRLRDAPDVVHA